MDRAARGMLSAAQVDRLAAEWRCQRETLPWRVRARLAVHRMVDGIGLPLAARGHWRAAQRLWRLFGMWRLLWTT